MKAIRVKIILLVIISCWLKAEDCFARKFSPFYLHQFALTGGLGDASAGGTEFPFCYSLGGYIRSDFNTFGVRSDYFGKLNLYTSGEYYKFKSIFYGFAFVSEHGLLMPQFGLGLMNTNVFQPVKYRKPGIELSFEGNFHTRGSGIGARFYYQRSEDVQYVGFMIQATIGWMWNSKKRDRIKSEGKGSF